MGTSVPIKLAKVVDTLITRVYINSITTQQGLHTMNTKEINTNVASAKFKIEFMLLMLSAGRGDEATKSVTEALELLGKVAEATEDA